MEYTHVGHLGLEVSRLVLGTMNFGPHTPEAESHTILDTAVAYGINVVDTANVYGRHLGVGATEQIIGRWFAKGDGRREKVVLATKVYGTMGDWPNESRLSKLAIVRQCEESLRRLQTDRIDLYQTHHIDRTVTPEEFWGTYERAIADGDVLYAGSSNFSGWGLAMYQLQAWQRGGVGFISEQTQYNLLSRVPEMEVLPAAEHFGIGGMIYMPLAGGLLTGKVASMDGSRTAQVEQEYGISLGPDNTQFSDYSALCRDLGETEAAVAIAWTLHHPAVDSAIVGVRTVEQLDGLDRAAELELTPETLERLDEIFDINRGRKIMKGESPEAHAW
jgi:NDP-hexose C3-ketoreductase / dTDP-4-oxo-2-deoxy-alpha-D-pentos-2-ene 2,3-reductase